MKNMKMYTKVILSFVLADVLMALCIGGGYAAMSQMLSVDNPEAYIYSYNVFTGLIFVIMISTMTLIAVNMTKSLKQAVNQVVTATKKVAMGDLDIEFERKQNDEFKEIMVEFQKAVNAMHYQANIVEEVAAGNMTVEVEPRSEEDVLGISLKKMVTQNHASLSDISDAAYQVTTSSTQVASASVALAQGSTEQASAIEQITASIDEIAERTNENAVHANEAASLMTQAISDVEEGNQYMNDMVAAMNDINSASESIAKIIKTIDDIAFQTNILALNAAVEAARAGDAGKGFAVVAEEVRNLAAKSSQAAAETAELIENSIRKVEAGSRIADSTAKALETITGVVKKSEGIITGIAETSNYQATAVAQIDQAIGQVSQVVQTNSATSEQCAAASEKLSGQADRMHQLLSVYNLGDDKNNSRDTKKGTVETKAKGDEQVISLGDGFGKY